MVEFNEMTVVKALQSAGLKRDFIDDNFSSFHEYNENFATPLTENEIPIEVRLKAASSKNLTHEMSEKMLSLSENVCEKLRATRKSFEKMTANSPHSSDTTLSGTDLGTLDDLKMTEQHESQPNRRVKIYDDLSMFQ